MFKMNDRIWTQLVTHIPEVNVNVELLSLSDASSRTNPSDDWLEPDVPEADCLPSNISRADSFKRLLLPSVAEEAAYIQSRRPGPDDGPSRILHQKRKTFVEWARASDVQLPQKKHSWVRLPSSLTKKTIFI
ncbi:hypothetical protein CERSUDRAFT_90089 [Gelatoporia subvermispora B]|uniref:Uncharacterized protein n=1 Tax=Ceriporiopsis subvermispora (strain B) TaxID=914234 RepID=M2RSV6_CERS8|nr:hypothetical protein CERSUDRAFT_90089 [Gelatoporia subvermispora B]